jgi:RHS repeat-associated protein
MPLRRFSILLCRCIIITLLIPASVYLEAIPSFAQDTSETPTPTVISPVDIQPDLATATPTLESLPATEIAPTPSISPSPSPTVLEEVPATPTITSTVETLPPDPAQEIVVAETFDSGNIDNWIATPAWAIVNDPNGGQALQIQNSNDPLILAGSSRRNVTTQIRLQADHIPVQINLRATERDAYTVILNPSGEVTLSRSGQILRTVQVLPAQPGIWRLLRLSAIEDILRVAVDNIELIAIRDPQPLPEGLISINALFPTSEITDNNAVWIDNVVISVPVTEIPSTTVVNTPLVEPTTTPLVSTSTPMPSSESLSLLLIDSFDTDTLPYWKPNNDWAVEFEGGNSLLHFTHPDTTLFIYDSSPIIFTNTNIEDAATEVQFRLEQGAIQLVMRGNEVTGYTASLNADGQVLLYRNGVVLSSATIDSLQNRWTGLGLSIVDTQILVKVNEQTVIQVIDPDPLPAGEIRISGTGLNHPVGLFIDDFQLWVPSVVIQTSTPLPVTPTILPTEATQIEWLPVLTETFSTYPPVNWEPSNNWVVNENGWLETVTGDSLTSLRSDWFEGGMGTRFQIHETMIRITLRQSSVGNYVLELSSNGQLTLYRVGQILQTVEIADFDSAVWHQLRIAIGSSKLSVLLDESEVLSAYEDSVLPPGSIRIEQVLPIESTTLNSIMRLDDLSIILPASTTTVNPTATPTVAEVPTESVAITPSPTTEILAAPSGIPLLGSPANNGIINSNLPNFTWDAVSRADAYDLEVDNDRTFRSPEIRATTDQRTFTPEIALRNGVYFWRVRGINGEGEGPYSTSSTFTLDTTPPSAPILQLPADSGVQASLRPAFRWGVVTGATQYRIDIATDNGFSTLVVNSQTLTSNTFTPTQFLRQGTYFWRVAARDAANNWSPWSATRSIRLSMLQTPASNAVITHTSTSTGATPTFVWLPIPGAATGTTYQLQIARTAAFTSLVYTSPAQSATRLTLPATNILYFGIYYWRVNANVSYLNATGAASTVIASNVLTISPPRPVAPTFPVTSGTLLLTNDFTPDLIWNRVSYTFGSLTYEVQLDNNPNFLTPEYTQSGIAVSGTGATHSQTVTNALVPGVYLWRVRATNSVNQSSLWSPAQRLTIDVTPPPLPTLTAPLANAVINTLSYPRMTWTGRDSVRYRIEIARDPDFADRIVNREDLTVAAFTTTDVLPQGIYYWRVSARDAVGNWSQPTAARAFEVTILISPARDAVIFSNASDLPIFTWRAWSTSVVVRIARDPDFVDVVEVSNSLPAGTTTWSPTNSLSHNIYFWRLELDTVPLNPRYWRRLTVSPVAPGVPTFPTTNGTPSQLNDTTPDLIWNKVSYDPVQVSPTYDLQVASDAAFNNRLFQLTGIPATDAPTISQTVGVTLNPGTYFWRVRAVNSFQVSSLWSSAQRFSVDLTPPAAPAISAPTANAVLTTLAPRISWSAVRDAARYRVEIASDEAFTVLIEVNSDIATPFFVPATFLPQGVYFVRVSSRDAAGNWGIPSPIRSFRVDLLRTPVTSTVFIPRNNATTLALTFEWFVMAGAVGYEVNIARDAAFTEMVYTSVLLPAGTLRHTLPVGSELPFGIYYWRVNVAGVTSTQIVARSFIVSPVAPPIPTFPGAPSNPPQTNDLTPDLTWNTVVYPATSVTYTIQVDNTINFSSPEFTLDGIAQPATSLVTQTVNTDLAPGVYNWRVKAINNLNVASNWSAVRRIIIDTTPPAAPPLSAPANLAMVNTLLPRFQWGLVRDATRYRLDVATDTGFTNLVVDGLIVTTNSFTQTTLLNQGVYFWRVSAQDAAGNWSLPSNPLSFVATIQRDPPNGAFVISPSAAPIFSWFAIRGAVGYTLEIDDNSDFASIAYTSGSLPATATSHTLPGSNALAYGLYFWRVRIGAEPILPTLYRTYAVSPEKPGIPTFPFTGGTPAYVLDATPTLIWNAVTYSFGDLTYDVEVDNNVTFASPEFRLNGITTPEQLVTNVLGRGRWYWRVRARNQYQVPGDWSLTRIFHIPFSTNSALQGRVLDANAAAIGQEVPLAGATIRHLQTGATTTTDANGVFTFLGLPPGEGNFDFDGSTATAPVGPFGAYRSKIFLEIDHITTIDRPIYIMRVDIAGQVMLSPNQAVNVSNPNNGVTLSIPAFTVLTDDDRWYSGPISVSSVPEEFTPSSLPDTLEPGSVITIQPMGLTFDQPVPLTFPNTDGLAPGSEVDFWSMDHATSRFFVAGRGRVSADGLRIETISGGVRESSWHFPMPPAPNETPASDAPPTNENPQCPTGSFVNPNTGCMSTSIDLPGYFSLGSMRGLELVYTSSRAYPHVIMPYNATILRQSAVPNSLSYQFALNGVPQGSPGAIDTSLLSESVDESLRLSMSFDASGMTTGIYPYNVRTTSNFDRSSVSSVNNAAVPIVNERNSAFGSGWGLAGLQRINFASNNAMLLVDGDGSYQVFNPAPIDLRGWRQEGVPGNGVWQLATDGFSVRQTVNLDPTLFVSSGTYFNTTIRGRLRVGTDSDTPGDFIGFVFGYQSPIATVGGDPNNYNFLLFDWKQGDQQGASEGFSLARVNGIVTDYDPGFWRRTDSQGYEVLASDLGPGKGWQYQTDYDFELTYSANQIVIKINGDTIFTVSGDFVPGRFGFYNYSQANVTYSNFSFTEENTRFVGPDGDYSTLVRNGDGTFTRRYADGSQTRFNAQGLQIAAVDTNGNTTTYAYDTSARLISVRDPAGLITTLTYGGTGRLVSITDPSGRISTFVHDNAGNLLQVNLPDGTNQRYGYDGRSLMTSETDQRGQITTRTYDSTGRLVSVNLPGNVVRQTTNSQAIGLGTSTVIRANQAVSTFTDGEGRTTRIQPGVLGQSAVVTDASNLTTTYTRDRDGNPTQIALPSGAIYDQTFDGNGNLLTFRDRTFATTNQVTSFTYEPTFNNVTAIRDPLGQTTNMTYDTRGNLSGIVSPLGRAMNFSYDSRGLVTRMIDPLGLVTTYAYDVRGNLTEINEGGRITRMAYTPQGYVSSIVDPLGRTYGYTYDALGRVTSETLPGNRVIYYGYDANGNMTSLTPPGRPAHTFSYTPLNLIASYLAPGVTGSSGNTTYLYNNAQQPTLMTRPDGRTVSFGYDTAGRLSTLGIQRGAISMSYDSGGRLSTISAPGGINLTYGYRGEIPLSTTWSGPVSGTVSRVIDADYRVTSISVNNAAISYAYNNDDQVTGAGAMSLSYQSNGLLAGTTLNRVQDTYAYSPFGEVVSYSAVNPFQSGENRYYNTAYSYDNLGRITRKTEVVPAQPILVTSHFLFAARNSFVSQVNTYATSQPIQVNLQPGYIAILSSTPDGRTGFIADDVISTQNINLCRGAGGPCYISNGGVDSPGLPMTQVHDPIGPLNVTSSLPPGSNTLTFNLVDSGGVLAGNTDIYLVIFSLPVGGLETNVYDYGYDAAGRLVSVRRNNVPVEAYTYDANGNRTSAIINGVTSSATYDNQDRLLTYGNATYAYNANGDLNSRTQGGQITTYDYDEMGNLLGVALPDGRQIGYLIDGQNRRIGKTVNGALVRGFLWENQLRIAAELNSAGAVVSRFVYVDGVNVPEYMIRGGITYRIITDHLGSVRMVVNTATGQIIQQMAYDSFGRVILDTNPAFQPFGFAGGFYDPDTGLVRFGARDYDAVVGRWTAKDPIGFGGGDTNLYSYVANDPVNLIDPEGELWNYAAGAAAGVATGYALSQLTGQCYGWKDVLLDAATGATGAGIASKLNMLARIAQLRNVARADGMTRKAGGAANTEIWAGNGRRLTIKNWGSSNSPYPTSRVPRAQYRTGPNTYRDPFTGQTGPKNSRAGHIPLEPTRPGVSAGAGAAAGAAGSAGRSQCGCLGN